MRVQEGSMSSQYRATATEDNLVGDVSDTRITQNE